MTAYGDDRGAARPLFEDSVWSRHRPQRPGHVTVVANFMVAGLPGHLAAIDQAITDQAKPHTAAMFNLD